MDCFARFPVPRHTCRLLLDGNALRAESPSHLCSAAFDEGRCLLSLWDPLRYGRSREAGAQAPWVAGR